MAKRLTASELKRFRTSPLRCPILNTRVDSLSEFVAAISSAIKTGDTFWFRGHAQANWELTPTALRYPSVDDRAKALQLLAEFKRIAEIKLTRPPNPSEELKWAQLAQHYGLPTRLLDWTESATVALYFACLNQKEDGLVLLLNPIDLNRLSYPKLPRILDPQADDEIIGSYLCLSARSRKTGRFPLAINPVWNSERLMLQKGVFTLHGTRLSITGKDISSLVALPILHEHKQGLRSELQRIGVDELTIFPELEHSCQHLTRRAGLKGWS
jgi:FRG domain